MRLGEPLVRAAAGLGVEARERLEARDAARGELEHGLEDGADARGVAQDRLDLLALLAGRGPQGEAGPVAAGLAAALVLGGVERGVGGHQQAGRVRGVVRVAGQPGRAGEPAAPDLHLGDRDPGALGRLAGGGRVHAGQHDHELLAAEPADGVALAHDRAQRGGGERERAVALGVPERVVDPLEVVEVDDDDAHRRAVGGVERRAQALLAAAVVEQAGQAVRADLLAQEVALPGRVVGERGHRGEALDELDLGAGEGDVGARPVDVQRTHDPVVGEQRDGDERLRDLVGAGDHGAQRLEQRVGHVARAPVADDPARHAAHHGDLLGHDLLDPVADGEHGLERVPAVLDLVEREVVEGHQRGEVVRDPAERAGQRVRREDARRGVDERLQRRVAGLGRGRNHGHLR